MAQYRAVEGAYTTIDTLTNLTTFGGETGVGPIKVPADSSRLVEIWVAFATEIEDSETQSLQLRLSGKGMRNGDEDFGIGASAGNGTIALGENYPATIYPVDLEVVPNENVNVAVMAAGSAIAADGQAVVTLVFA